MRRGIGPHALRACGRPRPRLDTRRAEVAKPCEERKYESLIRISSLSETLIFASRVPNFRNRTCLRKRFFQIAATVGCGGGG